MRLAGIPQNEHERLTSLYSYHILDTLPEKDFDDITTLAAEICHTPMSTISIIDKDRQWLKSVVGLDVQETPRDISFCAHAVEKPEDILLVNDTAVDERFHDNPYVVEEPYIKFYAGVPLCTETGHALGTLCVIDTVPKHLTESQVKSLKALARQVVAQLELRKKNRELTLSKFAMEEINAELEQFARVVAHDLKSPCNNFIGLSEILLHDKVNQLSDNGKQIIGYISESAVQLKQLIDDILSYSRTLNFTQESIKDFTFQELMKDLKGMIQIPDTFGFSYNGPNAIISSSKAALLQILANFCNNAVRYNDKEDGNATILFDEETDYYVFSVTDNGPGIHPDNFTKIFEPSFTTLNGADKTGTLGQGIGLSTVKRLINKLGGEISIASKLGEGTTFRFTVAK